MGKYRRQGRQSYDYMACAGCGVTVYGSTGKVPRCPKCRKRIKETSARIERRKAEIAAEKAAHPLDAEFKLAVERDDNGRTHD